MSGENRSIKPVPWLEPWHFRSDDSCVIIPHPGQRYCQGDPRHNTATVLNLRERHARLHSEALFGHVAGYADDAKAATSASSRVLPSLLIMLHGDCTVVTRDRFVDLGMRMDTTTKVMLCGTRQELSHAHPAAETHSDEEKGDCDVVKVSGVLLDSEMTFTAPVASIVPQMYDVLCCISRIGHFLTRNATKLLIQSLVLGKFWYCSVVWGGVNQKCI